METYDAKFYENGKLTDHLTSSVDWELRRFISQHLPRQFNSIAVFAWMKGEAQSGVVAAREWLDAPLTDKVVHHKITLERLES